MDEEKGLFGHLRITLTNGTAVFDVNIQGPGHFCFDKGWFVVETEMGTVKYRARAIMGYIVNLAANSMDIIPGELVEEDEEDDEEYDKGV